MSNQTDFTAAVRTGLASFKVDGKTDVGLVLKMTRSVAGRAKNLDRDIHMCMVAAIETSVEHGDTTAAAGILNALGKAMRAKTAAEWFTEHSNISAAYVKDTWKCCLVAKEARKEVDIDKAISEPFWNKKEKTAADFNLGFAIAQLLKRAEGAKAKGQLNQEERLALIDLQGMAEKFAPPAANDTAGDPLEKVG